MRTNKFFLATAAFCALFASFSFISCGDNDDDKKGKDNDNPGVVVNPPDDSDNEIAFCKTYNGLLDVLFSGTHTKTIEDVTIAQDAANAGKYILSIKNFSFNGMVIGDIEVGNMTATTDENSNTSLSADGEVVGPETSVGPMVVTTKIFINTCKISQEGILTLNLSVKLYEKTSGDYAGEESDVVVSFDSSQKTTDDNDDNNGGNENPGTDDEEEEEEEEE